MSNCTILRLILKHAVENYLALGNTAPLSNAPLTKCGSFLCLGDESCNVIETNLFYHLITSATHIIINIGNSSDFTETLLKTIEIDDNWAQCFDKRQVNIIKHLIKYIIKPTRYYCRFGIKFVLHGMRQ